MTKNSINFRLFHNGEVVESNLEQLFETCVNLVTDKKEVCKKLKIVEHIIELHPVPKCLIKNNRSSGLDKYVHRLDAIIGGQINPDPLNETEDEWDPREIETKHAINLEIWEKVVGAEHENTSDFRKIFGGTRFDRTIKLHFNQQTGVLLHIFNFGVNFFLT